MKEFIKLLERKVEGCDALGGMEREKAVYQSVLKDYRKAINYTPCCEELREDYLQPELDKYKNIKVERTKGRSDM